MEKKELIKSVIDTDNMEKSINDIKERLLKIQSLIDELQAFGISIKTIVEYDNTNFNI
jgi:hypothetical protein